LVDNEAMSMIISKNLCLLQPCNFPPQLFLIKSAENFELVDLSGRHSDDQSIQDINITISDNYVIEWNSSRQIGGWIDTQYVSPDSYWIRSYKIIENHQSSNTPDQQETENIKFKIEFNSQATLSNQIHAELSEHLTYEQDKNIYLIARDGHRVRSDNANIDRLTNSSKIYIFDILNGRVQPRTIFLSIPLYSN
jgi:hypothetical protein